MRLQKLLCSVTVLSWCLLLDMASAQIKVQAPNPTATILSGTLDEVTVMASDSLVQVHDRQFIDAGNYASIAAAMTVAASNGWLVHVTGSAALSANLTVPANVTLWVSGSGMIDNTLATDTLKIVGKLIAGSEQVFTSDLRVQFFNGSVDKIHPEWWGAVSDSSTASLAGLKSAVASARPEGNVLLIDGTYSTTDSLLISGPVSLTGSIPPRRWTMIGSTRTNAVVGPTLRSINNSNATSLRISSRGVNLTDMTVIGDTSKNSGVGIRLSLDSTNTTMGDNTLRNVHSGYHKLDGFRWECPDNSSMMIDCDANINRGFGVKVQPKAGASGGPGINFTMIGGRTRRNGFGGLNLDSQLNSSVINSGFIADTTYGVLISGGTSQDARTTLIGVDIEQQVLRAGGFPSTSLRIINDSRQGLFANNFLGVSTGVVGTTVRRRVSLGGLVRSSIWINNQFSGTNTTVADTAVVVEDGATVHALWLGDNGTSGAFDPIDSVDVLGSGIYRAAWIGIDHNNTGGEFRIKTNKETEFVVKGTSADTLFINNISGVVSIDGDAGLELSPSADAGVTMFKNSFTGENRTFRVYGDSAGTPRYLQIQIEASSGRVGLSHQTDQFIVMRSPLGIDSDSYVNFIERSALPSTPVNTNGVLTYKTNNHLWTKDDNGDSTDLHVTQNIGDTLGVVLSAPGAASIVRTGMNTVIDSFGAAALDTVVTLTGKIGDIIYVRSRNSNRDITFLDSGNFALGAGRVLDNVNDLLVLLARTTTTWVEIAFSNND